MKDLDRTILSDTTDTLHDIHNRLVHMSEGLVGIGIAATGEHGHSGLGSAVYVMGIALDDISTRLESVTDQLRETNQ
ncbi:hypothetical protein [Kineobactrum salinum]|uniref:Methyl-accepting transducer domain-containing protein n=1 Tax=Kineobactrum salinum TaxID=2708301 RepID=A0A6C0U4P9_9GAMM|nr:hypothetical protein [Kineobactrum salinum]QIB66976.1 hypothetical protein G3T16_17855 [Kineobactrum salinum]